ncbi:hypothetical protein ACFQV4_14695 [Streptomyces thermocarboxydus]
MDTAFAEGRTGEAVDKGRQAAVLLLERSGTWTRRPPSSRWQAPTRTSCAGSRPTG